MKNIVLQAETVVPIYGFRLYFVVAHDALAAMRASSQFGDLMKDEDSFDATVARNGAYFGLYIQRNKVTPEVIGHEIHHLTHRLMAWAGCVLGEESTEAYAYLCGWLHDYVYTQLKKHKIRVR